MTDYQFLYFALVAVYLSECFFWVRRGSLVLCGGERGSYSVKYPSPSLGNETGGLIFVGAMPPAGGAFVCQPLRFSVTPEAAAAISPQSLDPAAVAPRNAPVFQFDKVKSIRAAEDQIRVDDALFVAGGNSRLAAADAKLLLKFNARKQADRGKAIDQALKRMTDTAQIGERLDEYDRRSRWLRIGCHVMFTIVYLIPPMALIRPGILTYWPIFLAAALICDAWIASTFYFAHKRLFRADWAARWKAIAIMALAPTAAIRACHALSRDLLSGYDPLACAAVLCDADGFRRFARRVLMDLAHSSAQCEDDARSIRDAFAQRLRLALEPVLAQAGTTAAELLAPPAPQDPSCIAYCPRCDAQFAVAGGICEDCGGVSVLPLKVQDESPP